MAGTVAIHQPGYFPWLGYLHKAARCDRFVVLDDVAANKAGYQYRNTFYCDGKAKFLTLPVNYRLGIRLDQLEFKRDDWRDEHLDRLRNYYLKAPAFEEVFPLIQGVIGDRRAERPLDVMLASMRFLFESFGLSPELSASSELGGSGHKGELVLSICEAVGAATYVSGRGAMEYMDESLLRRFDDARIRVEWLDFEHPVYPQADGRPFVPGLSAVDLLFFAGVDAARDVLKGSSF